MGRIGFASKRIAGCVSTLCNPPYIHKLTNLYKFEIDRPSGSRENNEKKNRLQILHGIDAKTKMNLMLTER